MKYVNLFCLLMKFLPTDYKQAFSVTSKQKQERSRFLLSSNTLNPLGKYITNPIKV